MVDPGTLIGQIPEFRATHAIKIAPDTSVPVTDRLLRLIDSRTFQRLRGIRQLSLADRVFPSATHTRFSHALGVFHNVLDYLRFLDRFPEFHGRYSARDYTAVMLAGLLHDLGHYPCSHQLDHLPGFPKHEDLTVALIEGDLRYAGEDLAAMIRDSFGLEPKEVTRFFKSSTIDPRDRLLLQLIDSPLDADKCDYLPRDSYFCGVDYGTGFDRQRFIANLMPTHDGNSLCIHEKGLVSAERFQLARYWMYRSVYWGHTVRAFITMLAQACRQIDPKLKVKPEQLLAFNDSSFLDWLMRHVDDSGRDLIDMLHTGRRPYKRLMTLAYNHGPDTYRALQSAEVRDQVTQWVRARAREHGADPHPYQLVWDVPPRYKTERWETFPVRVNDHAEIPIEAESPIIEALGPAFLQGVRKIRFFAHPDLVDAAGLRALPPIEDLIQNG